MNTMYSALQKCIYIEQYHCQIIVELHLGIDFYFFVSHNGMKDRGSTCNFRNERSAFRQFSRGYSVFHNTRRKKENSIPYKYTLSKVCQLSYEMSDIKTTGRYSKQLPVHTSREWFV